MATLQTDEVLKKIKERKGTCARCGMCAIHARNAGYGEPHEFLDAGDEPIFVLRAQDAIADTIVVTWIEMNRSTAPPSKLREALEALDQMTKWPVKKDAD